MVCEGPRGAALSGRRALASVGEGVEEIEFLDNSDITFTCVGDGRDVRWR